MIQVLGNAWALLLGLGLLMVGNGLQGTLLGVRGSLEGFSTFSLSLVMSAYFVGFLGGSWLAPGMIRRVGHVRVFAALGSFTSAVLILFPTITEPWAWIALRVIIGFCFSGVYVTAESWLNNAATNETRGQALSLYMITMMIGIIAAQGLMAVGDPSGFVLFIIPSVLVSLSFAPILLSVTPTPPFDTAKRMTLTQLFTVSPLGCVGVFLLGGVFGAQYGMAAVYATQAGLGVQQLSLFVAMIYLGALVLQMPIGWLSDRIDRRVLILGVAATGGVASLLAMVLGGVFTFLLIVAFVIGGMANPLYSLLLAYTNDFLETDDMASASGGLIFINGIGAVAGPVATGWTMSAVGPSGFWLYIAVLMLGLAAYALFRMGQRPAPQVGETGSYVAVSPAYSPVALEAAQEWWIEEATAHETETSGPIDDEAATGSRG